MKRTTTFTKGSGVYKCNCCGRKTRDDGGDSVLVRLCGQCWELGGIENQISDEGSTPELEAECAALRAVIVSRGGIIK